LRNCVKNGDTGSQAVAMNPGVDVSLPEGYVWYETMIVLRPDMDEEER